MPQLLAPLPDFLGCGQEAVHGADRAVVDALVEQAGIDLGGRLIGEARRVQKVQHDLAFDGGQGTERFRSGATHGLWPRQTPALTIDAGARQVQSRARTGGEAKRWRQRDDGIDHDASSLSPAADPARLPLFWDGDDGLGMLPAGASAAHSRVWPAPVRPSMDCAVRVSALA
jgi:hypothetical protein